MTLIQQRLLAVAAAIHRIPARSAWLASLYLGAFRVLKCLPDGRWKRAIERTVEEVQWPEITLPSSQVELAPGFAANLVPHVGEFDFAAHLYRRMQYEQEVCSWLAERHYDVVIEIGANVGFYSILFSLMLPEARIYSFEPAETPFRRLLENLTLNKCKNVVPFKCAIASSAGFLEFFEPSGHLTNGSLDKAFAEAFGSVTVTRVPSLGGHDLGALAEHGKRMLIKIDAEGLEPRILCSLQPLILAERPDMIIEVVHDAPQQLNQIDYLHEYRIFQLLPEGAKEVERFALAKTRDYALVPRASTADALIVGREGNRAITTPHL